MSSNVEFIAGTDPIVVCVLPAVLTPGVVDQMATGFEQLFLRGDRYALVSCNRSGASSMLARERRLIADWANQPRVRAMGAKLCVGGATLVESPVQRATLTAILWFWTPAFPHHVAGTASDAVDFCTTRLESAGMKPSMPRERLVRTIEDRIR